MPVRIPVLLTLFALLFHLCAGAPARAEPKPWVFGWNSDHWDGLDYRPHMYNGKHNHKRQWDHTPWNPQDWVSQYKDPMDLIKGFYNADIIRDQDMNCGNPVLVVGSGFYKLSGYDKRRVTQAIDYIYEATAVSPYRFSLKDYYEHSIIGYYDRNGLFLE